MSCLDCKTKESCIVFHIISNAKKELDEIGISVNSAFRSFYGTAVKVCDSYEEA